MDKLQSLPDACFPNLGIAFQNLQRVAFTIFGFDVYWYGVFICLGVLSGLALLYYNAKSTGQDPDPYIDFLFYGIISGIVGARLYYVIFFDKSIKNFFAFREGGLAIYGGIIGAFLASVVYTRIHKIPFLKYIDTYAPPLMMGQVVGRLGNFVNREAFGKAYNGLFALMYKADQVSHIKIKGDVAIYRGAAEYPLTVIQDVAYISVHPTFLYELSWNLMTIIIMLLARKNKRFEGQISCIYLLFYGIGRFFIESLRTDQLMIGKVPVSMIVSAVIAVTGGVLIIVFGRKKKFIVK
ncbi:MAG: prolipoprotein diacylglyceryl transferase [Firmicutes bacterium]|nr:prolipoprotein diacylglyceryl transferase [Bacillota bacterium]